MRHIAFAAGLTLMTMACQRDTAVGMKDSGGSKLPDLGPAGDLASVDANVLLCHQKNPKLVRCNTDGGCLQFEKCVMGVCCGGQLDPVSCICSCAGRECVPWTPGFHGELCCTGVEGGKRCKWPVPPNPGVLMCRPWIDCNVEENCQ